MSDIPNRRIDDATPFHAAVDWKMGAMSLAAAAVAAYAFRASLTFDVNAPDFNPIAVVPLLLAGYGAVQLGKAVGGRRVTRRFGHSVFDMRGQFAHAGETLEGRIVTDRDLAAPGGFVVRLRCIERRRIRETAGTGYRDEDRILWEASSTVRAARTHADGIPVSFPIPADATARAKDGPVRWTLEVEATVDGARYEALFGVPVAGGPDDDASGDEEPVA